MFKEDLKEYKELSHILNTKSSEIRNKVKEIINPIVKKYDINYYRVDISSEDIEINFLRNRLPENAIEKIKQDLNAKNYNTLIEEDKLYVIFEF